MLNKGVIWKWTDKCKETFEELKDDMMKGHVLTLLDISKPFEVQLDKSDYALGGVFLQKGHPVAFENRKLFEAKRKYIAQKKELLFILLLTSMDTLFTKVKVCSEDGQCDY